MLIQCLWRCYAADKCFHSEATWNIHVKTSPHPNVSSLASTVLPTQLGKTLMEHVAKRGASVLKRRKSRNRMDPSGSASVTSVNVDQGPPRSESDGDVVFYAEENRASGEY